LSGISPGAEPNDGWRNRPISQKQAELLHDLSCEMFARLTRGEAWDMIARMIGRSDTKRPTDERRRLPDKRKRPRGRPREFGKFTRASYDNDTLEDNK
jgi:hypothetical protein